MTRATRYRRERIIERQRGNLGVKYLTTLGNTSPEPYGGLRKSSGGEYRHGCWSDAIMNPDGTFYVLNWGGEGPPSIQQIDPKQQFHVIWGGTTDNVRQRIPGVRVPGWQYAVFYA